jgi:hypothetical protein
LLIGLVLAGCADDLSTSQSLDEPTIEVDAAGPNPAEPLLTGAEPDPEGTASLLPSALHGAIAAQDEFAFEQLSRGSFKTVYLPGGGSDTMTPPEAMRALSDLPPGGALPEFDDWPSTMVSITDTLRGIFNPDFQLREVLFSRGWGPEGRGESAFLIMQHENKAFVAGRLYAEAGFSDALESTAPVTRTVDLYTRKPRTYLRVDIPSGWHRSAMQVESMPPLEYMLRGKNRNPAAAIPGPTKIEVFYDGPSNGEPATLESALSSLTFFNELPIDRVDEYLELAGGYQAVLTTATFEQAVYTNLYIDLGEGIVAARCSGEPSPCAAILRTVRVGEEP